MRKFSIPFAFAFALSTLGGVRVMAQAELEAGNKLFKLESYYEAIDAYRKPAVKTFKEAEKNKNIKGKACFQIAECYRLSNNFKNAEQWYDKAIKAGYNEPNVLLEYANVL